MQINIIHSSMKWEALSQALWAEYLQSQIPQSLCVYCTFHHSTFNKLQQ